MWDLKNLLQVSGGHLLYAGLDRIDTIIFTAGENVTNPSCSARNREAHPKGCASFLMACSKPLLLVQFFFPKSKNRNGVKLVSQIPTLMSRVNWDNSAPGIAIQFCKWVICITYRPARSGK